MRIQPAKRIISVGGGKGGVGKSIVSCNLALAMAQTGARVVLVDADLGGANQHTLLGIDKPGHTLQGLFEHTIQSLEEAIVPTVEPRLGLIPGSGAVVGAANISFQQKQKLIRHVRSLDADAVVIDVGAGVSFNVLDLFDAADLRLVVMTSQLTSLQNAYAFLKGAVFREIRRFADTPERMKLIEESPEASVANRRIPEMLARLHHSDPSFEKAIQNSLLHFGGRVIGNNLGNSSEQAALQAISRMTNDFLGIDAPVLGFLMASQTINNSVSMRKPFLLQPDGIERSAATLRGIARILLTADISALRRARENIEDRETSFSQAQQNSIPSDFANIAKSSERFRVRCKATLIHASFTIPVIVHDISESGARLDSGRILTIGASAKLVFGCLPSKPGIPCLVRRIASGGKEMGVEFVGEEKLCKQIVSELAKKFAIPGQIP